MNKFPIYPNYDCGDYCGYEFDPQTDFADFLSEARNYVSEGKVIATPQQHPVELGKNHFEKDVKKSCKKSWKSSLFSWLKTHNKKKNQQSREPSKGSSTNKLPKRGCVSGPITSGIHGAAIAGRPKKPISGPLTNLFSPMNRADNEIPYLCLQKLNDNTPNVPSFGPVYLVT